MEVGERERVEKREKQKGGQKEQESKDEVPELLVLLLMQLPLLL